MNKLLLGFSICVLTTMLTAEDWPKWRGTNGDGISQQKNILKIWPKKGLSIKWSAKAGAGYSGISVVDNTAYTLCGIGNEAYCVAYNCSNGKIKWKKSIGTMFRSSWGDGPRSTPTVHDDKIYVISSRGKIHCFSVQKGSQLWAIDIVEKFNAIIPPHGFTGSLVVYKDTVLYNVGGNGNSFVAFHKDSGKVIWKTGNDKAAYSTAHLISFHKKIQTIFFTALGAVGINPENGKELWRYPWKTSYDVHAASPIFKDNKVFISSGYSTGSALFEITEKNGAFSTQTIWKTKKMKNHFSSSILWEEHLYGFHNGILTCLDFKTGKVKWRQRGFQKGSLVGVDGHMIILSENGDKLALANLNSKKYQEQTSMSPFTRTKCWSVPTIANGYLYLRNEKDIMCLKLEK